MGAIEKRARKHRKKDNIQRTVLSVVGLTGVVAAGLIAPNVFQALPKLMGRERYRVFFQARSAAARLAAKGYIRFEKRNGQMYARITALGTRALEIENQREILRTSRPRWDKRWRIVMFDIPHSRRKDRDRLRSLVRSVGFLGLQRSVWIYPYDCEELIALIKADMRIGKAVLYAIVESLENDAWVRAHFNLLD